VSELEASLANERELNMLSQSALDQRQSQATHIAAQLEVWFLSWIGATSG